MPSPPRSFHDRVVVVAMRCRGFRAPSFNADRASIYFPRLTLTAVFPVPNTS
jgi:hypothetical protein